MIEIKPVGDAWEERNKKVLRMLNETINLLGGPRKIAEYRNLTWIPSLIKACYAIILKEEEHKTSDEIAQELATTKNTIRKMLEADEEEVKKKIEGITEEKIDEHIAGGLAKLAFKLMKRKQVEEEIENLSKTSEILGVEWSVKITQKIKGLDFPVNKSDLLKRLEGVVIFDKPINEILDKLEYPVPTPANLLHQISQKLKESE